MKWGGLIIAWNLLILGISFNEIANMVLEFLDVVYSIGEDVFEVLQVLDRIMSPVWLNASPNWAGNVGALASMSMLKFFQVFGEKQNMDQRFGQIFLAFGGIWASSLYPKLEAKVAHDLLANYDLHHHLQKPKYWRGCFPTFGGGHELKYTVDPKFFTSGRINILGDIVSIDTPILINS
ncbi:hypothetical protein DFH27DRAFT_614710 [Peziza echinospora]|nr:hypothetical protein DFH27DRAFT_614710 [Peziza echinospora]